MFDDIDARLRFVPNTNALIILIDNIPLMQDQFEEICEETDVDYVSAGCGFKLADPLDHGAYVEVIVTHRVRSSPKNESFQLTGIFVTEGVEVYSSINAAQIFTSKAKFVVGEDQLEIFVEGKRLNANNFVTMVDDHSAIEEDKGKMSDTFKILIPLNDGEKITYKISHYIWSYDQLDRLLKETRQLAEDDWEYCKNLDETLQTTQTNWATNFETLTTALTTLKSQVEADKNYFAKTEKIKKENLDIDVTSQLFNTCFEKIFSAADTIIIENFNVATDYVQVFYVTEEENQILLPEIEYTKIQNDNAMTISLRSDLVDGAASVFVTGFRIGG